MNSVLELEKTPMPEDGLDEEKCKVLRTILLLYPLVCVGCVTQRRTALKVPQLVVSLTPGSLGPLLLHCGLFSSSLKYSLILGLSGADHFRVQDRLECSHENLRVPG